MRGVYTSVLTIGLVVVLAAPAVAQQRQRGQRGQGGAQGIAGLVGNEAVQKELKLDKDQVDKAKEVVQKVRDNHKDDFAKLRDLSQEERREKGRELARTVSEETVKALGDVLKPEQLKRLKQIDFQQAGSRAFSQPEVQKALNLTEDQKEKIKTLNDDAAKERRELTQGGNAQASRDKLTTLRKETLEKIQAVLTADQKKAWKDLTGEPFTVPQGQRRQPRTDQ